MTIAAIAVQSVKVDVLAIKFFAVYFFSVEYFTGEVFALKFHMDEVLTIAVLKVDVRAVNVLG